MGWSICTLAGLWEPMRRAARALWGVPRRKQPTAPAGNGLHMQAGHGQVAWPSRAAGRPVRVLRVVEAAHPRATAGRMVISGRMADVCAELDRLAALEAAAA